jgi:G:T-mismatch repair DNA endonuclease (very short patch repair protein)
MPSRRLAVWVDGCFWHGCPRHGRATPFTGPNASLWEDKLRRTRARDLEAVGLAVELGWQPVRVWECEIRADPRLVARRLVDSPAAGHVRSYRAVHPEGVNEPDYGESASGQSSHCSSS